MHNINFDGCGPPEDLEKNFSHHHKKEIREPSTRGLANTVSEAAHQAEVVVAVKVLSHISLYNACIMAVKPTIT
jgi:hypothetical protein